MANPKYIRLNGIRYMDIEAYHKQKDRMGNLEVRTCDRGEAKEEGHRWCMCRNDSVLKTFSSKAEAMDAMRELHKTQDVRDKVQRASVIKVGGTTYIQVESSHPIENTDGVPLSDVGKKGDKAVQKAIKDSRDMYFKQKGGDGKKPKETGINPDRNGPPPHADGGGDAGDGGAGNGGGGDGGGGGE